MIKLDYARIKMTRLEQDVTQKELATATGVSLSTIKQIETGRSATDLENIEKLCAYLELDINEIYHPDYHDTKVLCMLNNKGGCGKTSLCNDRAENTSYNVSQTQRLMISLVSARYSFGHAPQREELRHGGAGRAGLERLHTAHQI